MIRQRQPIAAGLLGALRTLVVQALSIAGEHSRKTIADTGQLDDVNAIEVVMLPGGNFGRITAALSDEILHQAG
jgi:hypothetical protein